MPMRADERPPAQVLDRWDFGGAQVDLDRSGHINRTFRLRTDGGGFILQWLNPIFAPEVHHDIAAITARLAERGLLTPRLVPTLDGALWAEDGAGGVWRVLTAIEGETLLAADSPDRCAEAGRLLGEFHRALWSMEHRYHFARLGVHDTSAQVKNLQRALAEHGDHRLRAQVAPVADGILAALRPLPLEAPTPPRHVHGDPKISNMIFSPGGRALCLVDLDTLAAMPLVLELGDAFRSWCCPTGEDAEAVFRLDFFEAGLMAYAAAIGDRPTAAERELIPGFVQIIALELAARFCADALDESYFGWDGQRFATAGEHNLARARSQLALGRAVAALLPDMEGLVARAW